MKDSHNYGTEFNVTYQTFKSDGLTSEENIVLKIGENNLAVSKGKVSLTMLYTRWNGICYKINTTREVDLKKTEIKLSTTHSKNLGITQFFFTSEQNSYGVTNDQFKDGKNFSTHLTGGDWKEIDLTMKKYMNLACSKESFFEYIASRLSDSNFENCTDKCLRTTLPNEQYPICVNYEEWYDSIQQGNFIEPEEDCNWGIVRDLIKDTITSDDHVKTCETIEYSSQIMTGKSTQKSNELGIQYKYAFPLSARMFQEYLITDAIELVGSVGGTLGLFIGFSFSNLITCMIQFISTSLATRSKLSKAICTFMEWMTYVSFTGISIWFSWGALDKFYKQDTGIQQYEEKIEVHPTIVICLGSIKYQSDFTIQYCVGYPCEEEIVLAIGVNHLETLKEKVTLTIIYTRYDGMCYSINTTQRSNEKWITIEIMPSSSIINLPGTIPVIFTSERNAYGVTQRTWMDGEIFLFSTSFGTYKEIDLTVEKNINLKSFKEMKCSDESFYDYVASRLSQKDFERCNDTCQMTSLPNDLYPICPNYSKWYDSNTKGKELDCNWQITKELIENIINNHELRKSCVTIQYLGKIMNDGKNSQTQELQYDNHTRIYYKFASPLKAKVYKEYLITDAITLIGSVGGTLGFFIGFSINNVANYMIDFLKSTMEN